MWDPTPDDEINDAYWYDPNAEEAANFICTAAAVDTSDGDYIITAPNKCMFYCDEYYVATVECLDGEWTGNPELGFWCYDEPTDTSNIW